MQFLYVSPLHFAPIQQLPVSALTNCPPQQPSAATGDLGQQGILLMLDRGQGDSVTVIDPGFAGILPIDFCNCGASQSQFVYTTNLPSPVLQQTTNNEFILSCQNPSSSPCVCDEDGECFTPFGAVTDSQSPFGTFIIAPFCDAGVCHVYVGVFCATFGDPNSGVRSTTTGNQFTCADFTQGSMIYVPVGENSPYIKASSVSCRGCINPCEQCSGPPMTFISTVVNPPPAVLESDAAVANGERGGGLTEEGLAGHNSGLNIVAFDAYNITIAMPRDPTLQPYRRRSKARVKLDL